MLDYPIKLFEPGQDSGTFIYTVPQIKRYRYNTYPWWETNALQYPLPHSTQYLFRTYGLSNVNKSMPLSKNPFFVPDPNGYTMHDWMDTVRYGLQNYVIGNDKWPGLTLNWDNNHPGDYSHINITVDTTASHGESRDYYFEGSATYQMKNPRIFTKFTGSIFGVLNGKYTTVTSVRTEFAEAVKLSINNLYAQSDGVNISKLHEDIYLFTWEQDSTLWIYDSLDGRHPWYIAYLVADVAKKINLLSPGDANVLGEKDLLFNWEVEGGELQNCRFVVANSPQIQKGTIIYQEGTSDRNIASVSKTLFTPGKTYYWAVTGKDENGHPVWSPARSFTMKPNDTGHSSGELKASVYPNPGNGDEIRIVVCPSKDEPFEVTLLDMSGRFIASAKVAAPGSAQTVTTKLPAGNLKPGIYFLKIKASGEQIIRKVVIQ